MFTPQMAMDLTYNAIMMAVKVSAPIMIATIIVGVAVNIIQTVTSIKDQTISFVPKIVVAVVVLTMFMPYTIQTMVEYFENTFMMFGMFGR